MPNQLAQLAELSTLVVDSGDFSAVSRFKPQDATTNPSLVLKALATPAYEQLLEQCIAQVRKQNSDPELLLSEICDQLIVAIGARMLGQLPGVVSSEVDARLSFDTRATISHAQRLIECYRLHGIEPSRVLIKIAATWEGIKAAEQLERQGIRCNLTLLFCLAQARACAEAGVTLISPFVGRILDWHLQHGGAIPRCASEDPGVRSVAQIYDYYKRHSYNTVIMAASFRNVGQILALAGCDRLTIAPTLMAELTQAEHHVPRKLIPPAERHTQPMRLSENEFRWQLNGDAMATEKLAEGIRNFAEDQERLESLVRARL